MDKGESSSNKVYCRVFGVANSPFRKPLTNTVIQLRCKKIDALSNDESQRFLSQLQQNVVNPLSSNENNNNKESVALCFIFNKPHNLQTAMATRNEWINGPDCFNDDNHIWNHEKNIISNQDKYRQIIERYRINRRDFSKNTTMKYSGEYVNEDLAQIESEIESQKQLSLSSYRQHMIDEFNESDNKHFEQINCKTWADIGKKMQEIKKNQFGLIMVPLNDDSSNLYEKLSLYEWNENNENNENNESTNDKNKESDILDNSEESSPHHLNSKLFLCLIIQSKATERGMNASVAVPLNDIENIGNGDNCQKALRQLEILSNAWIQILNTQVKPLIPYYTWNMHEQFSGVKCELIPGNKSGCFFRVCIRESDAPQLYYDYLDCIDQIGFQNSHILDDTALEFYRKLCNYYPIKSILTYNNTNYIDTGARLHLNLFDNESIERVSTLINGVRNDLILRGIENNGFESLPYIHMGKPKLNHDYTDREKMFGEIGYIYAGYTDAQLANGVSHLDNWSENLKQLLIFLLDLLFNGCIIKSKDGWNQISVHFYWGSGIDGHIDHRFKFAHNVMILELLCSTFMVMGKCYGSGQYAFDNTDGFWIPFPEASILIMEHNSFIRDFIQHSIKHGNVNGLRVSIMIRKVVLEQPN